MRIISTVAIIAALATPAAALQVVNVLGQNATPLNNTVLTNGAPYFDEEKDNQLGRTPGSGAPYFDEAKDNQLGYASNYGAPYFNDAKDNQLGRTPGSGAPYFDEAKDNQIG